MTTKLWGIRVKRTGDWMYENGSTRMTPWTTPSRGEAERDVRNMIDGSKRYEVGEYTASPPSQDDGVTAEEFYRASDVVH